MPKYYTITLQQGKPGRKTHGKRSAARRRTLKFPDPQPQVFTDAKRSAGGVWDGFGEVDMTGRFNDNGHPSNRMYGGLFGRDATIQGSGEGDIHSHPHNFTDDERSDIGSKIYPDGLSLDLKTTPSMTPSMGNATSADGTDGETYVIKYTKLSNETVINKEVFVQKANQYDHYLIDDSDRPNHCWKGIPLQEIGAYLNRPFDPSTEFGQCGVDLAKLGNK